MNGPKDAQDYNAGKAYVSTSKKFTCFINLDIPIFSY